tara:strand:- start:492 stop:806 length:315 start_codon:yes stop_codon:yes gene_type:complete
MDNTTTTLYTPDMDNLDKVPSCDIFGYLMSSYGITNSTHDNNVVELLYILKRRSNTFAPYIDTILTNIIGYGDIDDYMEHLTDEENEFITSNGEVVSVADLSDL